MALSSGTKTGVLIAAAIAAAILGQTLFIVKQTEIVLINRLGEVQEPVTEPGLYAKIPFIDKLIRYDNRLLGLFFDPKEVVTKGDEKDDTKRIIIDAYAKYRITDPKAFYTSVRDEIRLKDRISPLFENSMRREVGKVRLSDLLSERRGKIMESIEDSVNRNAEQSGYGIEVDDVRIVRADLPQKNSQAVYERMISQHEKEARQIRAEGEEEALKIRSEADKNVRIIEAAANKEADIIRGQGDGEATKIYAETYSADPEFYGFYRTMEAYRNSLSDGSRPMRLVLSPDNAFFSYFQDMEPAAEHMNAARRRARPLDIQ